MTAYLVHDETGRMVSTGTVLASNLPPNYTVVNITDQEFEDIRSGLKVWVNNRLEPSPRLVEDSNRESINDLLQQAMTTLQTIIDSADILAGTLTAAQLSNHVRSLQSGVKTEARILRRVIRYVRDDFSSTD